MASWRLLIRQIKLWSNKNILFGGFCIVVRRLNSVLDECCESNRIHKIDYGLHMQIKFLHFCYTNLVLTHLIGAATKFSVCSSQINRINLGFQ